MESSITEIKDLLKNIRQLFLIICEISGTIRQLQACSNII